MAVRYLVDLTKRTLALSEPGVRIIDSEDRGEHVLSVLPDPLGYYDLNCAILLAALGRQARGERMVVL